MAHEKTQHKERINRRCSVESRSLRSTFALVLPDHRVSEVTLAPAPPYAGCLLLAIYRDRHVV